MFWFSKKEEHDLVTMDDIPLDGKRVLVRVDFNVAIGDDGKVDDDEDYRIEAALPTIRELQKKRCKVILLTHFGRPGNGQGHFDLDPVISRLEYRLNEEVKRAGQMSGDGVMAVIDGMEKSEILVLPNVRQDEREMSGSEKMAEELAGLADVYINEAFSVCHRDHTSVSWVPKIMPACAGRRTINEYEILRKLAKNPARPYVAIISGAKVHTKINLLRTLLDKVDAICVGGVVANMFLANQGKAPRDSFTYEDMNLAQELWDLASHKIIIPKDVVIGSIDGDITGREVVSINTAQSSAVGVWDVGPETVAEFLRRCEGAATIMWNGPIGLFEVPAYSEGTRSLAMGLAEIDAYKVTGGGDTVHVLDLYGLRDKFDHVSVGGGAMVALLDGSNMPGLEVLKKKNQAV